MAIRDRVDMAFRQFLERDIHLLQIRANERSVTHRFAVYIEGQFPGFNVDCEYNRKGLEPKRLDSFKESLTSDDERGVTVFPDVIVHHRGTKNNFIVIEVKLTSSEQLCSNPNFCKCDRCKLRAYKTDLGYAHAFYVVFPVDKQLEEFTETELANYVTEI